MIALRRESAPPPPSDVSIGNQAIAADEHEIPVRIYRPGTRAPHPDSCPRQTTFNRGVREPEADVGRPGEAAAERGQSIAHLALEAALGLELTVRGKPPCIAGRPQPLRAARRRAPGGAEAEREAATRSAPYRSTAISRRHSAARRNARFSRSSPSVRSLPPYPSLLPPVPRQPRRRGRREDPPAPPERAFRMRSAAPLSPLMARASRRRRRDSPRCRIRPRPPRGRGRGSCLPGSRRRPCPR